MDNNTKAPSMLQYSMNLGTCMGLFWIGKFLLVPWGLRFGFLLLLYIVLTMAVPFLGYKYVATYRDKVCGGVMRFSTASTFCMLMYIFASMLASVIHYVYFQFIDNGFIAEKLTEAINITLRTGSMGEAYDEALKLMRSELRSMTASDFTLQILWSDIYYCILLSIPTALFAMRRKSKLAVAKEEEERQENNSEAGEEISKEQE